MKNFWYEEHIEDPLKEIVRYLRNRGVNTECSCGHKMWIQCGYFLDGHIKDIHELVWCYLDSKGLDINFEISVIHKVVDSKHYTSLEIALPDNLKEKEILL